MSEPGEAASSGPRRSPFVRVLRLIGFALLVAFSVGFLIGTLIRREAEKPVRYMGARPVTETEWTRPPLAFERALEASRSRVVRAQG